MTRIFIYQNKFMFINLTSFSITKILYTFIEKCLIQCLVNVCAMEQDNKLPLKRVELSLSKFNDVAIPHHLELLRQHKANILKAQALGNLPLVRAEQTRCVRVAQQLRDLLHELDALRRKVRDEDIPRFDRSTQASRDATLRAIVDYLDAIDRSCRSLAIAAEMQMEPPVCVAGSVTSTDSVGVVRGPFEAPDDEAEARGPTQLQLVVDEQEASLQQREAVLEGWTELQQEVRLLHEAWGTLAGQVVRQRTAVEATQSAVDAAAVDVAEGRRKLSSAEKLRVGALAASGAVCGALVGGPVGLALGLKAGAAAALAGGLLGVAGARVIDKLPFVPKPTIPALTANETSEASDDSNMKSKAL